MANSPLAKEKYLAHKDNYTDGRSKKITEICIHHMAGVMTAKQCGAIFQRKGRNGSSNYGIGKNGEIAVYVNESDTAWCNSNWDSNCRSISIETSNNKTGGNWTVSDKVLKSLIALVADIAKRNKLGTLVKGKNVTWHSMYTNTACPGKYLLSKMDYIISEANKINGIGTTKPAQKPVSKPTSSKPKVTYLANKKYKGASIVDALNQIKVNSSFSYRSKLAKKNGIKLYVGSASQNTKLLNLLKKGKLIKA